MPRGKTHKKRATSKILTIPELRSSMEHITAFSNKLKQSKASLKDKVKNLSAEWKRVFGKSLPPKVAEAYLKNLSGRKGLTRKHRGGASPLAGAPLDYSTRPGLNLPSGQFTPYVDKGFWNPQPAILQSALSQQVTPQPGMGNNTMNGGGIFDSLGTAASAALFRPFVGQSPMSSQQTVMNSWKGLPLPPGGASYDQAWRALTTSSPTAMPHIPVYDRVLSQQGAV
jgi:hypothetical protein